MAAAVLIFVCHPASIRSSASIRDGKATALRWRTTTLPTTSATASSSPPTQRGRWVCRCVLAGAPRTPRMRGHAAFQTRSSVATSALQSAVGDQIGARRYTHGCHLYRRHGHHRPFYFSQSCATPLITDYVAASSLSIPPAGRVVHRVRVI